MSTFRRVAVVMAGGTGERFWPISRPDRPKQLLRLSNSGKTMLEDAVERVSGVIKEPDIYIATTRELLPAISESNAPVRAENILGEPMRRNTAGCLVWAAANLLSRYKNPAKISMAVVTADHLIGDYELFKNTVRASLACAEEHRTLVVHGVVPTRPETGYGYIQAAEREALLYDKDGIRIYRVAKFHEKPGLEDAQTYMERGDCYWNGGMFFWRLDTLLEEMMLVRPEYAQAAHAIAEAFRKADHDRASKVFEELPSMSIDVALMEKTRNVAVLRAEYPWDDVGSWLSLERTHPRDANGNVIIGKAKLVDCKNTIVYQDPANRQPISVLGADSVIVVVANEGVLVAPKSRAQNVRDAVP